VVLSRIALADQVQKLDGALEYEGTHFSVFRAIRLSLNFTLGIENLRPDLVRCYIRSELSNFPLTTRKMPSP